VPEPRPEPSDFELTVLAERTEMAVWRDCVAAAPPNLAGALGLRTVPVVDGMALLASRLPSLLYNRTFGIGLERELTPADVEDAIALYAPDAEFTIQPTPHARPAAVHDWLDERGMRAWFNWVRWVRDTGPAPDGASALEIAVATPADMAEFSACMGEVFHEPRELLPWLSALIGRAGWTHYLARDQGRVVATAALHVAGEVGWLGWAGTLKGHRCRGAQSALVARRIADARAAGCRWITVETADDLPDRPNPSFRNMARAGFRLLYRRPSHVHLLAPA